MTVRAADDVIARLEEIAANAVPGDELQIVDGWLLRASPAAPFRRCNSVLPLYASATGLDERIALVEDFYRRRDLPVRYQLSPAASPAGLEDALIARGYALEVSSLVQVCDAGAVLAATAHAGIEAVVAATIDDGWLAANADAHGDDDSSRARVAGNVGLLVRIRQRVAVATVHLDGGGPAGAAFLVVERGWGGVFGMATRPEARRRGVATALLHALARHALATGAPRLYLQVEDDNEPALALYARSGFASLYGYHYRTLHLHASHG